ncbi:MAG TPA: hypothetical protein VHS31_10925 [Tepidisphaeraceae bacterium]|jgi:hypothetical protein|nr:hypothetical protein [Tepidisphaeraceae bacterium]
MLRIIAVLIGCVVVSSVSAQIIYEPIRYQYSVQTPYYYGGNDSDVFRSAARDHAGAKNGYVEAHGDYRSHREVSDVASRVYVDEFPRGNAAILGYTDADARNAAYQNAPRYFRKIDLLMHAMQDDTGAWHVPAQISGNGPGTIEIKPYVRRTPAMMPKPILIFPKDLLNKPATQSKLTVADSQ